MLQKKIKSNCLVVLLGFSTMLLLVSVGCKKPVFTEEETTVTDTIVPKKTASRTIPVVAPVTFPADLLTAFPAARWMSKINGKVKLSHLSIPGTRWSAQYQPSTSGQYQALSISQQLNMGVRYLHVKCGQQPDLRVIMNNNTSIPFDGFVDTLKTFLNQNIDEAIVVMLEQDANLPYPENWAGHIRNTVDENIGYFYKWPNYYSASSAAVGDWPALEQVRKKIILLSHSDLLKNTFTARVLNNSQITLGWNSNGSSNVTASVLHQFSQTTGASKVDAVDNTLQKADTLASTVHSLFLNETGIDQSSSASVLSDANYVNPKIDDVLEGQYNENLNYGRFGIVAMNYLSDYTSKLIYLTNFNRRTKQFKATVLGSSVAFTYNSNFSDIQGYPISQLFSDYTETPNGNSPGNYSFPLSVWNYFPAADWMSKIPDGTLITNINIPGTHDAGTSTGSLYGKCQDWTIAEQLSYGVRFLDLRLKYLSTIDGEPGGYDGVLKVHHGPEIYNINWQGVLSTLTDFLDAHPGETIILKTQMTADNTSQAYSLLKTLISDLGKANYFWKGSAATTDWPRMRDLRGKILLMQANRVVDYGSIDWSSTENTTGANATASIYGSTNSLLGYAQEVYKDLPTGEFTVQYHNKWEYIRYTAQLAKYEITLEHYNQLFLNYTSYVGLNPKHASDDINPRLKQFLDNEFSGPLDIQPRSGIYVCDFMDWKMSSGIYLTNFSRTQVMNSF